MVSRPEHELLPRIFASIPAEKIVAISAGGEPAINAAKDVFPPRVLTDPTTSRIAFGMFFVEEIIVVTVDLQFLLELRQLFLARAEIGRKITTNAVSCTEVYASESTCLKSRLVIVAAVAIPPFRSAAIAEFCFTATAIPPLAADIVRVMLCRTYRM